MVIKYLSKAIISWEDNIPTIKIESSELEGTIHVREIYLEYNTPSGIDSVNLEDIKDKLETLEKS